MPEFAQGWPALQMRRQGPAAAPDPRSLPAARTAAAAPARFRDPRPPAFHKHRSSSASAFADRDRLQLSIALLCLCSSFAFQRDVRRRRRRKIRDVERQHNPENRTLSLAAFDLYPPPELSHILTSLVGADPHSSCLGRLKRPEKPVAHELLAHAAPGIRNRDDGRTVMLQ